MKKKIHSGRELNVFIKLKCVVVVLSLQFILWYEIKKWNFKLSNLKIKSRLTPMLKINPIFF